VTKAAETAITTLRYRAVMRLAYSVALLRLMEYARSGREEFKFGPVDLDALEDQGLVVSGPDLSGVLTILADIPGLYLSDS